MLPLATQFEDATFTYTQIERHGDLAIFRQTHKASQVERYEVVQIRVRPAHTWSNGTTTPEHEAYPGAQSWGTLGWTCFTLADAQALAQQLQQRTAASAS
jgi:hypothetical protein